MRMAQGHDYITLLHSDHFSLGLTLLQLSQKFPDVHFDLPFITPLAITLSLAPDNANSLIGNASFSCH
jgi:hypothetical protein